MWRVCNYSLIKISKRKTGKMYKSNSGLEVSIRPSTLLQGWNNYMIVR